MSKLIGRRGTFRGVRFNTHVARAGRRYYSTCLMVAMISSILLIVRFAIVNWIPRTL